jgi:hypothetical protein
MWYGGATHGAWCNAQTRPWHCSDCGAKVFFFRCDCGCAVFFDKLGDNWPEHQCRAPSKSKQPNSPPKPSSLGPATIGIGTKHRSLVACPICKVAVREDRLQAHLRRCPVTHGSKKGMFAASSTPEAKKVRDETRQQKEQQEYLDRYAPPNLTYEQAKEIERTQGLLALFALKRHYHEGPPKRKAQEQQVNRSGHSTRRNAKRKDRSALSKTQTAYSGTRPTRMLSVCPQCKAKVREDWLQEHLVRCPKNKANPATSGGRSDYARQHIVTGFASDYENVGGKAGSKFW